MIKIVENIFRFLGRCFVFTSKCIFGAIIACVTIWFGGFIMGGHSIVSFENGPIAVFTVLVAFLVGFLLYASGRASIDTANDSAQSRVSSTDDCSHPKNQQHVSGYAWPMLFAFCGVCGKRYQRPWSPKEIKRVGDPRKNIR